MAKKMTKGSPGTNGKAGASPKKAGLAAKKAAPAALKAQTRAAAADTVARGGMGSGMPAKMPAGMPKAGMPKAKGVAKIAKPSGPQNKRTNKTK